MSADLHTNLALASMSALRLQIITETTPICDEKGPSFLQYPTERFSIELFWFQNGKAIVVFRVEQNIFQVESDHYCTYYDAIITKLESVLDIF